ncbi:MAG: imidazole glycerol phosphate synthase subunit HisH [Planctomycetota bacterium]
MITLIDLGISNIKSIVRGFSTQGFKVQIASGPDDIKSSESLVLPGVGAFPKACQALQNSGFWEAVIEHARRGRPLLGVCLGMQLLFTDSEEHGLSSGLDLIDGHVVRFPPDRLVPHMGWNVVSQAGKSPLFKNVPDRADFYFVHSFYARPDKEECVTGYSDHNGRFAASIQNENVFGTQFHPEKSQNNGLTLLRNYASLTEK